VPLRDLRSDLVGRRECSQQRLRLANLGHFRRWREAFNHGRED
jgi:hypothetical protein